ncbi:unnamed protein product [Brachionus calyciflorus]|uniref:Uncharacterized protein n=1 Tax=Brachionus calyciflorus TaxID=104777 RepID=A0A813M8Q3_9BILA|nr:unnamed protein product [Brachionus calyciflorus]
MDSVALNLNNRLEHASKKFSKACDQIKLLKQRIAELIKMFSYTENLDSLNLQTTTTNDQLSRSMPSFNKNLFNETIRQQIENLQSIKTAYFMYAHKKADEITKLQCELYGEDAVREAYEMANTSGNENNNETNSVNDDESELSDQSDNESNDTDDDDRNYTIQWELETDETINRRSSINNDHDYLLA